jgi:hypothetical protein
MLSYCQNLPIALRGMPPVHLPPAYSTAPAYSPVSTWESSPKFWPVRRFLQFSMASYFAKSLIMLLHIYNSVYRHREAQHCPLHWRYYVLQAGPRVLQWLDHNPRNRSLQVRQHIHQTCISYFAGSTLSSTCLPPYYSRCCPRREPGSPVCRRHPYRPID